MFIINKYTSCYFRIIERAKEREINDIIEKHHIIPKSFGGKNTKDNLVNLTPREHFICHHLLLKMVEGEYKKKMCYAFYRMCSSNGNGVRCKNLNSYDRIRRSYSHLTSGENNPFYGKGNYGQSNPMFNPVVREKHRQTVSSPEHKKMMSEKMSGESNPFFNKTHSEQTKKLLSELASERKGEKSPRYGKKHRQVVCEHCQKQITYPMYKRWHGSNCKVYQKS
jgi:hypothetical protein